MSDDFDIDSVDTDSVGLGDEDKGRVGKQMDWYKGEKGRTDRIAIIYFDRIDASSLRKALRSGQGKSLSSDEKKAVALNARKAVAEKLGKSLDQLTEVDLLDLSEPRFKVFSASYKKEVGYVQWPAKLTPEEEKIWRKAGEKRDYITTLILQYPTERDGDVDKERLKSDFTSGRARILPWRFSADKYAQIRKVNKTQLENGGSVASVDLAISCQDTGFQKLEIHASGACLYHKNDRYRQQVLEQAVPMYEKLNPFRQMTTDELREKLGMSGGGSSGGGADVGDDFQNVLGNL
jgi:hypothetical protein